MFVENIISQKDKELKTFNVDMNDQTYTLIHTLSNFLLKERGYAPARIIDEAFKIVKNHGINLVSWPNIVEDGDLIILDSGKNNSILTIDKKNADVLYEVMDNVNLFEFNESEIVRIVLYAAIIIEKQKLE